MHVTTCNQKLIRGTLTLLVFSARYFIMKCNNQRNLDISMAKVTVNLSLSKKYIWLDFNSL